MGWAFIGSGVAFVTRLKGVFTGGFILSATHVEQPANGTRRARARAEPGTEQRGPPITASPSASSFSFFPSFSSAKKHALVTV